LLSDDGLLSWRVGSLRRTWASKGALHRFLDSLFRYPNVLLIVAVYTLLASIILVLPIEYAGRPWLVIPLAACTCILFLRNNYGFDGADQLMWLIFAALVPVSLVGTDETKIAYLWFIAAQVSLAYGVAGIAKAAAKGWRDGIFLAGIVGTKIYGYPKLAAWLVRRPRQAIVHSRMIIFFECSFLLMIVMPLPVALFWLLAGLVFHLINAFIMGLNTFVWAFAAAYPALLYCLLMRGW
jgi:hypothetical protein